MPLTMTTVTGPVYLPNGATPLGGRVSFELSSWDQEEGEGLIITGPVYATIDSNGQFSVELFTSTSGNNSVHYRMFVIWEDSELSESYVNNIYVGTPTPHFTKKYIGSFALSGPGPFQVSDLNIISETDSSSFDAYLEMRAFADRIDLGVLDNAVATVEAYRMQIVGRQVRAEDYAVPETGDTDAAFARLESQVSGQVIDLGGHTYQVAAMPTGNRYINGYFTVGGLTRSTLALGELDDAPASVWRFGGQLARLSRAMRDPFRQCLKITLIGDSITWGATLPENGASDPRDGTGSDPRDLYATASWANEFTRWIGSEAAPEVTPTLSNWPAAPSGESIREFNVTQKVFLTGPRFTITKTGGSQSDTITYNAAYPVGAQLQHSDASGGTSTWKIAFTMTGKSFGLEFWSLATTCKDYTVWVDGVQLGGTYSTTLGAAGAPAAINIRTHDLGAYVVDALIEIRAAWPAGGTGTHNLYLSSIVFEREIVVSNQGINGATFRSYWNNMLTGDGYGDGIAVDDEDGFIFIQLGTNDRGIRSDTSFTLSENRGYAETLLTAISTEAPNADLIMMCANRPTIDGPPTYKCRMIDIRQMLLDLAEDQSLDMIDNYQAFARADADEYLDDGLHPNRSGHALIARNVINAIRGV